MGVAVALVFASKFSSRRLTFVQPQTSEPLTEPPSPESVSAQWVFWNPNCSSSQLFQSLWLVSWVSTASLSLSSFKEEVSRSAFSDVTKLVNNQYTESMGYKHLASGLCCGFSSLAAGLCIGIVGDAGVRANAQQEQIFVAMILILIFAEALGLYGMIVAIILSQGSWAPFAVYL